jgi:hypothetical protein
MSDLELKGLCPKNAKCLIPQSFGLIIDCFLKMAGHRYGDLSQCEPGSALFILLATVLTTTECGLWKARPLA